MLNGHVLIWRDSLFGYLSCLTDLRPDFSVLSSPDHAPHALLELPFPVLSPPAVSSQLYHIAALSDCDCQYLAHESRRLSYSQVDWYFSHLRAYRLTEWRVFSHFFNETLSAGIISSMDLNSKAIPAANQLGDINCTIPSGHIFCLRWAPN